MINAVTYFCQNYYDQLPADGLRTMGLSAFSSFCTSIVFLTLSTSLNETPADMSRVFVATGISVLAATIHAVTTPIFNYLFDNPNNDFNGFEEWVRMICDISLVHILVNYTTAFKINLLTSTFPSGKNFIMLSHTLFKIGFHMLLRIVSGIPETVAAFHSVASYLNIDFNQNASPVYIAV